MGLWNGSAGLQWPGGGSGNGSLLDFGPSSAAGEGLGLWAPQEARQAFLLAAAALLPGGGLSWSQEGCSRAQWGTVLDYWAHSCRLK